MSNSASQLMVRLRSRELHTSQGFLIYVNIRKRTSSTSGTQRRPCSVKVPFGLPCLALVLLNCGDVINRDKNNQKYNVDIFSACIWTPPRLMLSWTLASQILMFSPCKGEEEQCLCRKTLLRNSWLQEGNLHICIHDYCDRNTNSRNFCT